MDFEIFLYCMYMCVYWSKVSRVVAVVISIFFFHIIILKLQFYIGVCE